VYEELQVEGYPVDYERVPITDEKAPKELDFDILVSSLHQFLFLADEMLLNEFVCKKIMIHLAF
jgi:hypothetical protein